MYRQPDRQPSNLTSCLNPHDTGGALADLDLVEANTAGGGDELLADDLVIRSESKEVAVHVEAEAAEFLDYLGCAVIADDVMLGEIGE